MLKLNQPTLQSAQIPMSELKPEHLKLIAGGLKENPELLRTRGSSR